MKTCKHLLLLTSVAVAFGCKSDLGVNSLDRELQRYTVLFSRNLTALNSPAGTERSIFLITADGSDLRDLSQHPTGGYPGVGSGWDSNPKFSPDGDHIAFNSNRQGYQDIYVMKSDGGNKTNLSGSADLDLEFDWSPDGSKLIFTRLLENNYVLLVTTIDGSARLQLTSADVNSRYPAWSPNGNQVAYSHRVNGTSRWQVFLMDADGSRARPLSDSTDSALFPQWSLDGTRVYYFVQGFGVKVKAIDGNFSNALPGFYPRSLSWSPDGRWFVEADSLSIVTISADLSSISRIYVRGFEPRISPDGRWLLFLTSNSVGLNEIHIARIDGSDERAISATQYGDLSPSWKPL